MEASHFLQSRSFVTITLAQPRHVHEHKLRRCSIVAVLTTPAENMNIATDTRPADAAVEWKRVYKDNWFDRMAINHLSQNVQAATGLRNNKSGYESLVEAATVASRKFNPSKQRELVLQALNTAFPKPVFSLLRTILPESKFAREYFAVFTTIFFAWLVGPCEVKESELNGRKEKNIVYIKKCRFLEETNCVGMCLNMCKVPSQSFIKTSLGTPVNMVPNFDDMSCEMIFGQDPPGISNDPALKQPCYKLSLEKFKLDDYKNVIAETCNSNTQLRKIMVPAHMFGNNTYMPIPHHPFQLQPHSTHMANPMPWMPCEESQLSSSQPFLHQNITGNSDA